jgi:hypothetical protein
MRNILLVLIASLLFTNLIAQEEPSKAIKIIPQASMKIGSQKPAVGGQFDLVVGYLINDKYQIGVGGGYCTNMGMGGATYPLYVDGRFYFSTKGFLFASKDESNNFLIEAQLGMDINNNKPYKSGFIAAFGFGYRFDFIKINQSKFPSFYAGLNLEYNHTKFKDEYRGFAIQDGHLNHTMLNIKIAIDIKPIKI